MKLLPVLILLTAAIVGLRLWLSTPPLSESHVAASVDLSEAQLHANKDPNVSPLPRDAERIQTADIDHLDYVNQWLNRGDYKRAAAHIDANHSTLTRHDLERLKRAFMAVSASTEQPTLKLRIATELFDDLDTWQALAQHALNEQDWHTAHGALLRASQLENTPSALEKNMQQLVITSSYLRGEREHNNDLLGIRQLFQDLHDAHPWYARFQLELAHAQTRLGEVDAARQSYQALRFDPEFGAIAETSLKLLEQHQSRSNETPQRNGQRAIPLTPYGTSLLIDTSINGRNLPLLLDTGASITALSNSTINELGLRSTGKQIQIMTANGQREATLYLADRLELGDLQLNNVEIAGIELEATSAFAGLLGTDALGALNRDFNYVIDQRQSALILNPR